MLNGKTGTCISSYTPSFIRLDCHVNPYHLLQLTILIRCPPNAVWGMAAQRAAATLDIPHDSYFLILEDSKICLVNFTVDTEED